VDRDNVKATFKKGVLHVTIAKLPGAQSARRQIPVTAG
jgi:HSP20 family molecular chaperone IbpA